MTVRIISFLLIFNQEELAIYISFKKKHVLELTIAKATTLCAVFLHKVTAIITITRKTYSIGVTKFIVVFVETFYEQVKKQTILENFK